MSITHLTSTSQLDKILSASKDKVSVIDFHATWCGPCRVISPVFEAAAKQYPNVNFLKCDVDAARDVASRYEIRAMPTFVFLKGSTKIDEIKGADKSGLEAAIRRHSIGSKGGSVAFSGKGQTLGGSSTSSTSDSSTGSVINLTPQAKVLLGFLVLYVLLWYLS